MLEIDAKSKGINQQQVVGTTLSNVVEGIEQAQDITNNQQVIEQNRQTIKAQEEKLKYLPQQLAIANANEVINFADKTIGMNHAEMEALAGADVATKAMGISQSARDSYQQFIQATPSEREALFDTPGFAQTVAQSPQLQKLIVPSLNEIIVNRTIGQNTEGLIRAEGLYGSIEGIYKPKLAGEGKPKTEAQLKYEQAREVEAEDLTQTQMISEMGGDADRYMKATGGDARLAYNQFRKEKDPNYQAPKRELPVTDPMQLLNSSNQTAVSSDGEMLTFPDGTTESISDLINQKQNLKLGQTKLELPQDNGQFDINDTYIRREASFMREQQLLGIPESEAKANWKAEITSKRNDELNKKIINETQDNRTKYTYAEEVFDKVEPIVEEIKASPEAREMLTDAARGANTFKEIVANVETAFNKNPTKYKDAKQLINRLNGLAAVQAKMVATGSRDADAAKELELYMRNAISSGDTLEGMDAKLASEKKAILDRRKANAARYNLIINGHFDDLESKVQTYVNDYNEYESYSGLLGPDGTPRKWDEERKKLFLSPEQFYAAKSKIENGQIRSNRLLAEQILQTPSELYDPSKYDAVSQSKGLGSVSSELSNPPEVQKSLDGLAQSNPQLFQKMAFGTPTGNAQMALVADGFIAARARGQLEMIRNSDTYGFDYAVNAMTTKDLFVIAMNESSLNPNAVSPAKSEIDQGYKGIFQLGKRAVQDVFNTYNLRYKGRGANELTEQDIDDIRFNPQTAFMLAGNYLNGVLPKYGLRNKDAKLIAYNYSIEAGLTYQRTGRTDHLPKETKDYLQKFKVKRAKISPQDASQLMMNKEIMNPASPEPETPQNGVDV